MAGIKYSMSKVNNLLSARGFTLADFEYRGAKTPLKVMCPAGHIVRVALSSIRQSATSTKGCPECAHIKKNSARTHTDTFVQKYVVYRS